MRNGIYFTLIVFLGTFAFTVIDRIGGGLDAGAVFFLASMAIGFLTTHYKKRTELLPIQKVINVVFIGIFALFGIFKGISALIGASLVSISALEGLIFLVSSGVLIYSLNLFMKDKIYHHEDGHEMA